MAFNLFGTPKQTQVPAGKPQGADVAWYDPAGEPQGTVLAVDPTSATSGMDAVIEQMYTSPKQEEKMRKASVANQRILAIGDALRHIGNIYHTVKGAPSQEFNKPWEEERTRYEKGKAVRDAANLRYMTYQQQKAAQDAKQKQWEATFNYNAAKDAALQQYRDRTIASRDRIADQNYRLGVRKADEAKAAREATQKETKRYHDIIAGQRAQSLKMQRERTTAYVNRQKNAGNGSKVAPYNTPKGKIYHNGGNTADAYQMRQLYYKAKEIDDSHRTSDGWFEPGYKPLISGSAVSSLFGGSGENYRRVSDALSRSGELADWAVNNLGWSYEGGTPASDWDQYAEDSEDDNWDEYLDE